MTTTLETFLRRGERKAGPLALLAAAGLTLLVPWGLARWLDARAALAAEAADSLEAVRADLELDLAERRALRDLASRDLARARADAASLSKSRRALFEDGLALSEERRLLEKQWEILTLWVKVDPAADRLHFVRGDQTAESLPLGGAVPRIVGETGKPLPRSAVIASKERFAHPERPKVEQGAGPLQWEPPQVGTSARAAALGEFVTFTREGLVAHGPPLKPAEHDAYPHLCLSLPLATARALYAKAFLGTKIVLEAGTR
jgi:hypothetical protein